MTLDVDSILDGGVDGQETLGGSGRFEALHLALAPSCRLMRILSPIVRAQALFMASRQPDIGLCRAVRAQLVRHQNVRRETLFLKQLAHQFHGCSLVAPVAQGGREPRLRRRLRARARTVCPQSSPPSHRVAISTSPAGVDGEVLGRTMTRTSVPIAAPFRRRHPVLAPRADLRRRGS
jgi:hypothetical protein